MGSIRIQAHQPTVQLRFQDTPPAPAAAAPTSCASGDQICLSGGKPKPEAPASLNLFAEEPKAASQQYMERLVTRQSAISVGPDKLQLQVATESAAPELLTSAKEPDPVQALQARIQNLGKSSGEQVIRTGALIQPAEAVQIQVGMASAVDTDKLLAKNSEDSGIKPGMYAGVAVNSETVSGKLAVDTAFGKPRVEVGTAVNAGQGCTLGLSYSQTADTAQPGNLRLGTEIHANQDTVVGVNLNQPLQQQTSGSTSVGIYLNTKF